MRNRKMIRSIVSVTAVLMLLVSILPAWSIDATAASEWNHSYAVTQNTANTTDNNFFDAANLSAGMLEDFSMYSWDASNLTQPLPLYNTAAGAIGNGSLLKDSTAWLRQNASTASSYRNAGYLDFAMASATRPVAITHHTALSAKDEFVAEIDVLSNKTSSLPKGIMIAPAGEFALVNGGADKGIYISLYCNGTWSVGAGIGGTIDPSTAAALSTANIASGIATTAAGACATSPLKNEETKVWYGGLGKFEDDAALSNYVIDGNTDLLTYCVKVEDGILSVWAKPYPTKVLSVALTDAYRGGNLSFVSFSQNYGAFAGMRIKQQAVSDKTEWEYTVEKNTSSAFDATKLAGIANDFRVYTFNTGINEDFFLNSQPTVAGGEAVNASTVTNTNAAPVYGYLNFADYNTTDNVTQTKLLTHGKTFLPTDNFYLEMDVNADPDYTQVRHNIVIAKPGQLPMNNDKKAETDTGLIINYNWKGSFEIAGAIDPSTAAYTVNQTACSAAGFSPAKFCVNNIKRATGNVTAAVTEDTASIYKMTICVQVKDGVVSVWNKANPLHIQTVKLNSHYAGGNVSYMAIFGSDEGSLRGMRLKSLPATAVPVKDWDLSCKIEQNTGTDRYSTLDILDIATQFDVYNWTMSKANTAWDYSDPVLTAAYPKGAHTGNVAVLPKLDVTDASTPETKKNSEQARNFGYLDITAVPAYSMSALTTRQTLKNTDEFLLEMDFLAGKTSSLTKYLMIAPSGQFAFSNDGNSSNDTGVLIGFDNSTFFIGGAVDAARALNTENKNGSEVSLEPFRSASNAYRSPGGYVVKPATYTAKVTETTGAEPVTYEAGILTICVEVRNNILTVWNKATPDKAVCVPLNEYYAGGSISFVSSSVYTSAFAGMRLKKYQPMAEGSYAMNPTTGILTVKEKAGAELAVGSMVAQKGSFTYVPTRMGFRNENDVFLPLYRVYTAGGNVLKHIDDLKMNYVSGTLDDPNIANYAVSIHPQKSGLRFISRFSATTDADGKEYYTAGGKVYEIVDYGMLLASQLLATADEVKVDSANTAVKNVSVKQCAVYFDHSEAFIDMAVTITGIKDMDISGLPSVTDACDLNFFARPYVTIRLEDGTMKHLYGDTSTSSYNSAGGKDAAGQKALKIHCVGDSITYGHNDPANTYWTDNFHGFLDEKHTVVGFGANGKTAQNTKVAYTSTTAYQNSLVGNPDVVVILLGTNDSMGQYWTSRDAFAADYTALVQTYQNLASKPTVLLALPPYAYDYLKPEWGINNKRIEQEIIPTIKEVAEQLGVQVVDTHTVTSPGAGSDESWYMEDGIHPLDPGRLALAEAVSAAIMEATR